jgi:hypothetical protein
MATNVNGIAHSGAGTSHIGNSSSNIGNSNNRNGSTSADHDEYFPNPLGNAQSRLNGVQLPSNSSQFSRDSHKRPRVDLRPNPARSPTGAPARNAIDVSNYNNPNTTVPSLNRAPSHPSNVPSLSRAPSHLSHRSIGGPFRSHGSGEHHHDHDYRNPSSGSKT